MNENNSAANTHLLPNGLAVHHVNKPETEFLYREIFLERAYLKNGITLSPGACVFDVGANIGMFALFVKHECPDANIFCFEPIPSLNELLARNLAPFGASARIFPKGVASKPGMATLTYYPGYSIMSGFHADTANDAQVLSSSIRKQVAGSAVKRRPLTDAQISEMANYTLSQKVEIACAMTTISEAIREARVEKIDLLKIDAEKSELQILSGIHTDDWKKIAQIVLEAHSQAEAEQVSTLLRQQGFRLTLEQEDQLANSGVFNIFAVR